MNRTVNEMAALVGGRVIGDGTKTLSIAVNDHRNLPLSGGLFTALQGLRTEGHEYLKDAMEAGAEAALIHEARVDEFRALAKTMALVAVADVETALWNLAIALRAEYSGPVVAITGSFGKTTTKNMVAAALTAALGAGCVTAGNMNNLLGVPLTLSRLRISDDAFLVVELGSNAPGEIARLADLVRPTLAVVTGVGAAHLEGFGDLAGVVAEKGSLPRKLDDQGLALFPSSFALLKSDAEHWPGTVRSVGNSSGDHVQILARNEGNPVTGRIRIGAAEFDISLPVAGVFNLDNAALALGVCEALGGDLKKAARALADFSMDSMRLEWRELSSIRFLVDAYNANPDSMLAALKVLAGTPGTRRVAVLGSMLELGESAAELHVQVGASAAAEEFDLLVFVGEFGTRYLQGAKAAVPDSRCVVAADTEIAGMVVKEFARPGDMVLLKGSRGAQMERILDCFDGKVN
jgi:UDP-N-acetylmuramoyl-tripeptide--D-alanyl-D-alanine ligase